MHLVLDFHSKKINCRMQIDAASIVNERRPWSIPSFITDPFKYFWNR